MENRKSLTTILLLILFAILLVGLTWFLIFYRARSSQKVPGGAPVTSEDTNTPEGDLAEGEPPIAVAAFLESFFNSTLPEHDVNGPEAQTARAFLTDSAKQEVDQANSKSISGGLATFIGAEDVPDQGYEIGKVEINDDRATVETVWKYPTGNISKTFHLVLVGDDWRIASVE